MELEVPTSATQGLNAIIPGILKGEANVKGYIDISIMPWATPAFVRAGASGRLNLGVGSTGPFSIPGLVTKVHEQIVCDGKATWDFDFKLSALAAGGTYVRAS